MGERQIEGGSNVWQSPRTIPWHTGCALCQAGSALASPGTCRAYFSATPLSTLSFPYHLSFPFSSYYPSSFPFLSPLPLSCYFSSCCHVSNICRSSGPSAFRASFRLRFCLVVLFFPYSICCFFCSLPAFPFPALHTCTSLAAVGGPRGRSIFICLRCSFQ